MNSIVSVLLNSLNFIQNTYVFPLCCWQPTCVHTLLKVYRFEILNKNMLLGQWPWFFVNKGCFLFMENYTHRPSNSKGVDPHFFTFKLHASCYQNPSDNLQYSGLFYGLKVALLLSLTWEKCFSLETPHSRRWLYFLGVSITNKLSSIYILSSQPLDWQSLNSFNNISPSICDSMIIFVLLFSLLKDCLLAQLWR